MRPILLALSLAVAGEVLAAGPVPEEWWTPAERASFEATPTHAETVAFLKRLERQLPALRVTTFGTSPQGRALPLVILSKEGAFTPEAAREAGKPVLLFVSGIHAGEIDGKDASLMLLRDVALGLRPELLDAATILFVPIFNVDGHERISPFNRPNQDGPRAGMGFRTTSAGHNLNRDHLKAEAPEMRAFLALFNAWRPDLHVDNHVTDGSEHDWVLTYSVIEAPQAAPSLDAWVRAHLPRALAATAAAGHRNGPYVELRDGLDPAKGFGSWVGSPRLSNGYVALRNRVSILVEMHSYKPYRARVLANRDFLAALVAEVGRDPQALREAVAAAESRTVAMGRADAAPSEVVLEYEESDESEPARFPVYAYSVADSAALGRKLLRYERGTVREIEVPWFHRAKAARSRPRPRGYLIEPGWPAIEERLRAHGLRVLRLTEARRLEVEVTRLSDPVYEKTTNQGHIRVTATAEHPLEVRDLPAGTLLVPADQPDFEVAVQLLEAESPDSLFSWGFLDAALERKEYIDPRVLDQLAAELLADPAIAAEWKRALEDAAFAADPTRRYLWWYRRTPYWDERVGLLPVYRLLRPVALGSAPW